MTPYSMERNLVVNKPLRNMLQTNQMIFDSRYPGLYFPRMRALFGRTRRTKGSINSIIKKEKVKSKDTFFSA